MRLLACLVATTVLSCFPTIDAASAADEWGSIEGQFLLEGDIPELPPLVEKGAQVADATVCAANGVPDDSLIVNPDNKGIANICFWMRKAPSKIHPDLVKSAEPEVVFDQVNCRFTPHILIARTDQTILVKNGDPINHNTHTNPLFYEGKNLVISPNDRTGVPFEIKKSQLGYPPVLVNCDSHRYMTAYWMVGDHPYVAVTDSDGKFKIENLPPGEHAFTVWHERTGWINCPDFKRTVTVKVEAGKTTTIGPFKVAATEFTKNR